MMNLSKINEKRLKAAPTRWVCWIKEKLRTDVKMKMRKHSYADAYEDNKKLEKKYIQLN